MATGIRRIALATRVVWEARWEGLPDPVSGKRTQHNHRCDTRKEAEAYRRKKMSEVAAGLAETPKDLLTKDVLLSWLETEARHRVRATTFYVYANMVRNHLVPGIGQVPLHALTPAKLQAWYSRMMDERDSASMVHQCHDRLRQALQMAQRQGLLSVLPTDKVALPRYHKPQHVPWTPEETERFLAAADESRYRVAYYLLACTGIRRGELLGLHWTDVDLAKGVLYIRHAYTMAGSRPRMGPTKSGQTRQMELPPTMVALLRAHRESQEREAARLRNQWRGSARIITTVFGGPCHPQTLRADLLGLLERSGVTHSSIHDFRHLHASTLLAHGASLPEVQQRLGHTDSKITLQVYSHIVGKDRTAEVIEGALFRPT